MNNEPEYSDEQRLLDVAEFVRVTVDALAQLDRRVAALEAALAQVGEIGQTLTQIKAMASELLMRQPPRQPHGTAPMN